MSDNHETFAQWDASYVLGALTAGDRRAYEAHLEMCERCRAAVAEFASMPGLLARARPQVESWDAPELAAGPPANLVDLVTERRLRRSRRLRTRVILGVSAVAAAVALAIAVPMALISPSALEPALTVALAPVGDSTMTATLGLSPVAWGTSIDVTCDYPAADTWEGDDGPWAYSLIVTDDAGNTSQVSTWTAVPGKTIHLDAGTSVPLDKIASIQVVSAGGQAILTGSLGS